MIAHHGRGDEFAPADVSGKKLDPTQSASGSANDIREGEIMSHKHVQNACGKCAARSASLEDESVDLSLLWTTHNRLTMDGIEELDDLRVHFLGFGKGHVDDVIDMDDVFVRGRLVEERDFFLIGVGIFF